MRQDVEQQDLFIDAPVWWEGLTGKRRLFVEYYCTDSGCFLNATASFTKAYRRTKPHNDSSVQSNSARLMRDPMIKKAIAKLLRSRQNEDDHISEYKILKLLETLTFYKPGDIVDQYANLKIVKDINELGDLSLCIAGIKKNRDGSREIKFYDRTKSLAMLMEYLKLIRPPDGAMIANPVIYLSDKDQTELAIATAIPVADDAVCEMSGTEE